MAATLAKQNLQFKKKLANAKAAVDDDISDDAAGMARKGYDLHHRNLAQHV